MVYEEKQVGTATTVNELIQLLSSQPLGATVDVAASCHMSDVEVWYDEGTNTVLLKQTVKFKLYWLYNISRVLFYMGDEIL